MLSNHPVSRWARNKRHLDLPAHEYTGNQNHCRFCYNEWTRLWRDSRKQLHFDPHPIISTWHCKACHSKSSSLNRRLNRELKQYKGDLV